MKIYLVLAILSLILAYASVGALIAPSSTPKICPPEPQSEADCPTSVCSTCDSLGRCIISNPNTDVVVAPDDRATVIRCTEPGACAGIDILCSYNASCDVTCVSGACENMWLDCGNSNHSCNVYCERKETHLAGFVCNDTVACNCKNTCGQSWNCTPGVSCRGDPCYRSWNHFSVCYPYRIASAELNYTYDGSTCDCSCMNASLVALDFGSDRYCVDPNAICNYDSDCVHGLCIHGQCECYNGWTGYFCDQRTKPVCQCSGPSFCGRNGECLCTGGFSGPTCVNQPSCALPAVVEDPCPSECDHCVGDTCVVHVRTGAPYSSSDTITCPASANHMRCLLICDTGACAGFHMTCSSQAACDFVCADNTYCIGSNLVCQVPGVPCRAHCAGSTIESRSIGFWGCPNQGTDQCDLCNLGTCLPRSNCTVGLDCPNDQCYNWKCNGGTVSLTDGLCVCHCPNGTFETLNEAGESTCLATDQSSGCGCLDFANVCINNTCICPGAQTGPQCNSTLPGCPPLNSPDTTYIKPSACDEWDDINFICTIINPRLVVSCPFGYQCIIKCYAGFCNGLTVYCDNGAGPCDLYCFGQQSCLMAIMKCSTSQPCNSHCSSTDPARDQVLMEHICEPFGDISSCSCNSTCLMQSNVQNPCYLTTPESRFAGNSLVWNSMQFCGADSQGTQLVPVPSADRSECNCNCPDPLDYYSKSDSLCLPICVPACDNGGQCVLDTSVNPPTRRCRCFSGWTGRGCTLRCFFPIPVEIVSCDHGVYIIANNMTVRSNESLLVLQDTPDAQVIRVNGSVIIQPNATVSFASNSSTVLQVEVGGDMTQQSNSTLKTSIVGVSGGTAVGSNITISGSVKLSGKLEVSVDPDLILQRLSSGSGTVIFTALQYGQVEGQFDTVTTTLSSSSAVLPDGCSQVVSQTQYEIRGLSLIFSLDRSRCTNPDTPVALNGSNPTAADSDATIAATNTAAIVLGIIIPVVAIGIATAVIIIKKKEMAAAFKNLASKMSVDAPQKKSVEMTHLSPSPDQNSAASNAWKVGKKGPSEPSSL